MKDFLIHHNDITPVSGSRYALTTPLWCHVPYGINAIKLEAFCFGAGTVWFSYTEKPQFFWSFWRPNSLDIEQNYNYLIIFYHGVLEISWRYKEHERESAALLLYGQESKPWLQLWSKMLQRSNSDHCSPVERDILWELLL